MPKKGKAVNISAEAVGVSIAAPPTDGEANTELIRYLAEVLDLKKSHISLDKVQEHFSTRHYSLTASERKQEVLESL
ncbi:UPF0235 protein C15orf40 like [Dissostichus eleginoides]|uniref:UPF0235 protein C15orf40 like n=1 Tax=Dissostichus eleginoides TaxID=100907 RepID=A0AAD9F6U9_DISEL|nr:UPF0235 protein C15orf40 like [Dissostichus eleginoides]